MEPTPKQSSHAWTFSAARKLVSAEFTPSTIVSDTKKHFFQTERLCVSLSECAAQGNGV